MSGKREHNSKQDQRAISNRRGADRRSASRRYSRTIGALWIVLGCLVVAVVSLIYLRDKAGRQAGWAADTLLNSFNDTASAMAAPANAEDDVPIVIISPKDTAAEVNVTHLSDDDDGSLINDDPYEQPDAPEMDKKELQELIDTIASSVGKDGVIGVLTIPKIDVKLPIISKWSNKLLKVSICRYQGGDPHTPGNLVVIGHNYKNGSHFGRLKNLAVGDELFLANTNGVQKRYVVYEMVTVKPDDFSALEPYRGECGLTLMTCYKDGTDRLFVRCEQVDA